MSDYIYCLPESVERVRAYKELGRDWYRAVIIDIEGQELYGVVGGGPTIKEAIGDLIVMYNRGRPKDE